MAARAVKARMPTSIAGKRRSNQAGFSYAMVLAAIVVVGILAESAHETTWRVVRADREAELLYRGAAYRRAIADFYQSNGSYPRDLDDLIKDPRSPSRRYLRARYPDPMASGDDKEWALVRASDGGISGVASRSTDEPLKKANFPKEFEKFAGAKSYQDWIFEYVAPTRAPNQPSRPMPVGPPALKTF